MKEVVVILIAFTFHALIAVSILVPNALNIEEGGSRFLQLPVRQIDLGWVDPERSYTGEVYSNGEFKDQILDNYVGESLLLSAERFWTVPQDCERDCSFTVGYEAPGLTCRDLRDGEYDIEPFDPNKHNVTWLFFNASANGILSHNETDWGESDKVTWSLNYIPTSVSLNESAQPQISYSGPPHGIKCQCEDATYTGSYRYANGVRTVSATKNNAGNSFSKACSWGDTRQNTSQCMYYARRSLSICIAFSQALRGRIGIVRSGTQWYFLDSGRGVRRAIDKLFNKDFNQTGNGVFSLSPKFTNLSEATVELFSQMTLSLSPFLARPVTVTATVLGGPIWVYKVNTLWSIYTPALVITVAIALFGLYCIRQNGVALDRKFSTIFLTTKSVELDKVYESLTDYDALLEVKLIYEKGQGFRLVDEPETKA
jgi:hypothetical protein